MSGFVKELLPSSTTSHNAIYVSTWSPGEIKTWVVTLFILTTNLFAARVAMPVCAMAMAKEFGWSKTDLGTIMGSFFWGYLTTQVIGGYMADKIGGDRVLWMSAVVWGTLTLLTPYVTYIRNSYLNTFALLTFIRVLLGVSQGVHYPSMMSLLGKRIDKSERSLPAGIVSAAANFGSLMCGALGSFVLETHGWKQVFYIIGVISLIWAYIVKQLSYKIYLKSASSLNHDFLNYPQINRGSTSVPWSLIFRKIPVWAAITVHFCMSHCFYILLSWLPTYFHEHFPTQKGWIYNVVPWAFSIPSSITAGWISDRMIKSGYKAGFTRKSMQLVAMLSPAFFSSLLPLCSNFYTALLYTTLGVSLMTFHHSGVVLNPQDIAPHCAGSVFGIMNAFGALFGFVGTYIAGVILDTYGSWRAVFSLLSIVNIFGVSVFIIWGTGEKVI